MLIKKDLFTHYLPEGSFCMSVITALGGGGGGGGWGGGRVRGDSDLGRYGFGRNPRGLLKEK